MDIDYVIMAVGSETEKDLVNSLGLDTTDKGTIKIDKNYQTSNPKERILLFPCLQFHPYPKFEQFQQAA